MRRFRLILIVLVLLAAAAAAGIFYLNRFVLPVKARVWVEKSASAAVGRPVSVGSVQINWWHGFVLEKVAIAEETSFGAGAVLEADRISGGILFLPIFKNREFIIPTLHVDRPHLRLIQNAAGTWNVQTLKPPAARPSAPARFRVLIPRVLLNEGQIDLSAPAAKTPLSLRLQNLRVDARLALPAKVEATASWEIQAAPPVPVKLELTYDPAQHRFHLKGNSDLPLPVLRSYLPQKLQKQVGTLEGTVSADLEANGMAKGPVEVSIWLETENLRWKKELEVSGAARARFEGKLPSFQAKDLWKYFKGAVTLDRITIRPVPTVEEVRDLSGEIQLDAAGARAERLTATIPPGIPVEFSGSVANDADRSIGFHLTSPFRLEQPPPLSESARNFLKSTKLAGQAKLDLQASGKLLPELSLKPSGILTVDDFSAEFPKGIPWSKGHAVLRWQPDLLTVSPLQAQLLDRPLELEGTLINFAQPEIDAHWNWGDLSAETQMNVTSEKMEIENLNGRYGSATFRVLGEIGRPDWQANLFAESSFRIEQVEALWPQSLAWISKNGLAGECSVRLQVQGDLSKPTGLNGQLNLSSSRLTAWKIPLENLTLETAQTEEEIELRSAQAGLAGGTVRLTGSLQRGEPKAPWQAQVNAEQLDLARLAQIFQWRNQNLSGQLTADWSGTGEGSNLASVAGKGAIRIAGAQILEFPLLGRFAELVGAPMLRTIAFQTAEGPFRLDGGKIQTDNFQLFSPEATITVAGWGGFLQGVDSPISWKFIPTFSPDILPEETRSKIGKVIAKGTSYLLGEVQVTGTWKEPKKKLISKPVTRILNEQLFNIQDILENLF